VKADQHMGKKQYFMTEKPEETLVFVPRTQAKMFVCEGNQGFKKMGTHQILQQRRQSMPNIK
jgi:hypothetical protein